MKGINPYFQFFRSGGIILIALIIFSGCATSRKYSGFTSVRKYQKNVPFIFKNNISLSAEGASKDEQVVMLSKLKLQLDDSARVKIKDAFFIFHTIIRPPTLDTNNIKQSEANMATALAYLGYYNPGISSTFDTVYKKNSHQKRVIVDYVVKTGKRTLIDTLAYLFDSTRFQELALASKNKTVLKENSPITKSGVNEETNRL
ncbi:MAG: hypothetical protein ABIR31_06065, partial [Ginsengibacter sp.]